MSSMDADVLRAKIATLQQKREQASRRMESLRGKIVTLDEDIASLRRAGELLGIEIEPPDDSSTSQNGQHRPDRPSGRTQGRSGLAGAIRQIVGDLSGTFTKRDIDQALAVRFADLWDHTHSSSVSGTLGNLVDRSEIVLVEKGSGRRPSIYRRMDPTPAMEGTKDAAATEST